VIGSGTNLTDSATLSNAGSPTGTITFYLFAPNVTPLSDYSNNIYHDTVLVNGNNTYTTNPSSSSSDPSSNPGGYLPKKSDGTGDYQWIAVYSGDANNPSASSSVSETVSSGITKVAAKAGTYTVGDVIPFTVTFTNPVTVDTSGGTPSLTLTVPQAGGGTATVQAKYVPGSSPTTTLTFDYTVQSTDLGSSIQVNSPLNLNSATIQDNFGNTPVLTFTPVTPSGVIIAASISSVTATPGTYTTGQVIPFTVTFTDVVNVDTSGGTPSFDLKVPKSDGSTATEHATYVSGTGTSTLTFDYTVKSDDLGSSIQMKSPIKLNGGTIQDSAGDTPVLTFTSGPTSGVTIAASITGVTTPTPATYTAGQVIPFTVTFTNPVTVNTSGGTPSITLTVPQAAGGTATVEATYASGTGTKTLTFNYTVQTTDCDSSAIQVSSPITLNGGTIQDNAGDTPVLTFTPPDMSGVIIATTISSVTATPGSYTAGQVIPFTVTFTGVVNVNTSGGTPSFDIWVPRSGAGPVKVQATYVSGTGTGTLTFDYTVRSNDLGSSIQVNSPIKLNSGTIQDSAGNTPALTFTPFTTSGVIIAASITNVTATAGSYTPGDTIPVLITFSNPVTVNTSGGAPTVSLTVGANTRTATYVSGNGSDTLIFNYTAQAGDVGTTGITINSPITVPAGSSIQDSKGDTPVLTFTDVAASGVNIVTPAVTNVHVTPGTYVTGQVIQFTVTFDSPVTVDTSGGTPSIDLIMRQADGSTGPRQATYVSGSGTSTLTFEYTVRAIDFETNGIPVSSPVHLNGGTILDNTDNTPILTFTPFTTSGVIVN
jgi:hypothetical protein